MRVPSLPSSTGFSHQITNLDVVQCPAATPATAERPLGWLPECSLALAVGVLLVAIADSAARRDAWWADALYWAGYLAVIIPCAIRLSSARASRTERIGLLAMLSLSCSLIYLLQAPIGITSFDEFLHWRTANDLVQGHHLFAENPLLPISPLYPGLEIITHSVLSLTGLTIEQAGSIVIAVAGLVMALALFLVYEQLTGRPQLAGLATVLYMANPSNGSFDRQFAYESLALPIALLVVFTLFRAQRSKGRERALLNVIAAAGICTVGVTHHVTAGFLLAILVSWALIEAVYRKRGWESLPSIAWAAALSFAFNTLWLLLVSSATVGYLAPNLESSVQEVLRIISGEGAGRTLFASSTGAKSPLLERLDATAAAVLTLLGVPLGLFCFRCYKYHAFACLLAIGALGYPASLALRFTVSGWEIAARSAAFVYFPLAFILALAVDRFVLGNRPGWQRALFGAAIVTVLFTGGIVAGKSPSTRLPRPYAVATESRSIEPQGIRAALWARDRLGPGNRLASDRTNSSLMGSYGEQRVVTEQIDRVSISPIFLSPEIGDREQHILQRGRIRYLLVDERISGGIPRDGYYYEKWERDMISYTAPLDLERLRKFDGADGVDRVFDSGDIVIYDVGKVADGS